MGRKFDNTTRQFVFLSPLGDGAFHVEEFTGSEAVSELFEYRFTLLSAEEDISPEDLLGKTATLQVALEEGGPVRIHGIVTALEYAGDAKDVHRYEVELRPWVYLLSQNIDYRVFQEKTTPQIVEEVLARWSRSDAWRFDLKGDYRPRPFCVQYGESDYAFICRLLEEEGIWFVFEHDEDGHRVVFLDDKGNWPRAPEWGRYRLRTTMVEGGGGAYLEEAAWSVRLVPSRYAGKDYSPAAPGDALLVSAGDEEGPEIYEWAAGFAERRVGEARARQRWEQLQAGKQRGRAAGNGRTLRAGHVFTIEDVPWRDLDGRDVVVLRVHAAGQQAPPGGSGSDGQADEYFARVEFMLAEESYRPPRVHRRPVIPGPQPAIVVGPRKKEIWTNARGEVKVQFLWDREGKFDERSSCWIRCRQDVAGKGWGQLAIPRVGQEVLVDFINGDPDRPVILGGLYNEEHQPPFDPAGRPQLQGVRTHSVDGGEPNDYNEIVFDDTKGEELVRIRGRYQVDIAAEDLLTVSCTNAWLEVKEGREERVGKATSIDSGEEYHLKAKKITISATDRLLLECGPNKIELTPGEVRINGTKVLIN